MTPAQKLLNGVVIFRSGDKIRVKETGQELTLDYVILTARGLEFRVVEDTYTYRDYQVVKLSSKGQSQNKTFFV